MSEEDAVVVRGPRGERAVFVPFTDGRGDREAYVLHTRRGREERVRLFVLNLRPLLRMNRTFGRTEHAQIIKASYARSQEEVILVEEAYSIYDYGEIYIDYGQVVYSDEYGVLASTEEALKEAKKIVKCTAEVGSGAIVTCILTGVFWLKCVGAGWVGAGVTCIIKYILH